MHIPEDGNFVIVILFGLSLVIFAVVAVDALRTGRQGKPGLRAFVIKMLFLLVVISFLSRRAAFMLAITTVLFYALGRYLGSRKSQ